jgi:hypothetical protein
MRQPPAKRRGKNAQNVRSPVRSPIDKPVRGGLVVGSVTTSESPLLYVFAGYAIFLLVAGNVQGDPYLFKKVIIFAAVCC